MGTRRCNGFGTLVYKGEGHPWLAKWMYAGKRYTRTTGCVDKAQALKRLEVITRPFRERREEDVLENLALKLKQVQRARTREILEPKDMWDKFKAKIWDGSAASSTLNVYCKYSKDLAGWLSRNGFKDAARLKQRDAEKYLEELAKRVGAGSFNNMLLFCRRMWKALADEHGLNACLWDSFKKMKGSKSMRRAFKPEELLKIVENAGADVDMMVLVALGIYTGLRLGDCACMKWESVDFSRKVVSVVPMKTKKYMDGPIEIPMHEALAKVLRDKWTDGEEYVSSRNKMLYENGHLNRLVTALLKKCGIKTSAEVDGKKKIFASFHSFRHTFVSMAINSGMSPFLIQRIVGHSNVDMTSHYWHEQGNIAADGIARLPDFVSQTFDKYVHARSLEDKSQT